MKLMVIDGNSIVNRAYYGIRMLTTKDGTPTNAVYGFLNILLKLLDEERPEALCVCFDLRDPTFRHLSYEGYKAQRKGMPEELAAQMPILKDVLDKMNVARYELSGWEADDLIGTIAAIDTKSGWDTVIVTGDKDSLQLVTEKTRVKLVSTRMGQTTTKEMTPAAFVEEYQFDPPKMVDLKALMGDASDNIPGVPGIGEKTALDLVRRYGTVTEIYENLEHLEIKPGALKKLQEGREMAQMSFDLATIHCDAPMDFRTEDALRRPYNEPALYDALSKLELMRLIDRLGLHGAQGVPEGAEKTFTAECTSEMVTDDGRIASLLSEWEKAPYVAVLVTPDLSVLAVQNGTHMAIARAGSLAGYNDLLRGLFCGKVKKISHNVKDLMNRLLEEGLSTDGFLFDTELAAYLLAPTDGSYALESLGQSYFNFQPLPAKDYLSAEAFGPLADSVPALAALTSHCALIDALYDVQKDKLETLGMHELYYGIELPLCPVLAQMERAGFLVDRAALTKFGVMLDGRMKTAQTDIFARAGMEFNLNSPKQMGEVLFEKLGLPPLKKTKSGYSTNADVLEKLRDKDPIIGSILEYRQLSKLKSTYVDGLDKVIGPDGRIHTSFQNTVTATGRLSSTEPNLQNIPVRSELGAELRYMFVAGQGNVLVDADYSQIELRLLAHIANDPVMQNAFRTGEDIHRVTASQVLGIPPEDVTPRQRSSAKAVNFGIVYGISEFSLAEDIGVSRKEAKEYIETYLEKYSGVRLYMADVVEKAKQDGYVTTLYGRRRWLPELKSSNFNLRSFGERVALNMPIQGTAADLMKIAMIRVDARLKAEKLAARLVLQVHDELIVECPEGEAEAVKTLLAEEMEGVAAFSVPLTAEANSGKTWGDAH